MWQDDAADREETHTGTHSAFHLLQQLQPVEGLKIENIAKINYFKKSHVYLALHCCRSTEEKCELGNDKRMQTATCYYGYIITQTLKKHESTEDTVNILKW